MKNARLKMSRAFFAEREGKVSLEKIGQIQLPLICFASSLEWLSLHNSHRVQFSDRYYN